MKKFSLLGLLCGLMIIAGCGSTNTGTNEEDAAAKGEFAIESCNKYFELMECSMSGYEEEEKAQMATLIDMAKEEWKSLPEDQLQRACDDAVAELQVASAQFEAMGCSI